MAVRPAVSTLEGILPVYRAWAGSKVAWPPADSTIVHRLADGQATAVGSPTVTGRDAWLRVRGLNVTSVSPTVLV
jgi:hypothetical protein